MFKRFLGVSSAALLVALQAPAGASPAFEAVSVLHERVAPARARVAAIHQELDRGGVLAVVRSATVAAGLRQPSTPQLTAPGHGLRGAAQLIAGAVSKGTRLIKQHAPISARRAKALLNKALFDPDVLEGMDIPDAGPALRAAANVAAAIDRAMPVLRAAATHGRAPRRDAVCDVFEQPQLCVGGTGDNTYAGAYPVMIDLGGNDTYTGPVALGGLGVSVLVDVAGNDRYESGIGQGYGSVGVGMLVDAGGNDVYRVAAASAGGQALGFFGGAGFLVDAAGNDSYELAGSATGAAAGFAGQGEGFFGGVAALADGGGDDTYSGSATADPVVRESPTRTVYGNAAGTAQGAGGFGGTGLLADSGGTDSFSMTVRWSPAPADGPSATAEDDASIRVGGQGESTFIGAGYLLVGPGKTTYSSELAAGPAPFSGTGPDMYAQVQGSVTGTGSPQAPALAILDDDAGDDSYSVTVAGSSESAFTAQDGCACDKTTLSAGLPVTIRAQGSAYGNSVGLLEDSSGNDAYALIGTTAASVSVIDDRSVPGSQLKGIATGGGSVVVGQGAAGFYATGALLDATGDDSYSAVASSDASGSGTGSPSPKLLVSSGPPSAQVQGSGAGLAGVGGLLDTGGSDRYTATASSVWTTNDTEVAQPALVFAQGSVDTRGATAPWGLAIDIDGTGTDVYMQSPSSSVCEGVRGQSVWQDCGGFGFGANM